MKKLLPLLAVAFAVPAQAQDGEVYYASATWPVHAAGRTCTMHQAQVDGNALSVSYDGSEVTLITTNELASPLAPSGRVDMGIVFLENGHEPYDVGWGERPFAYTSEGGVYRFSTRFTGERNVRQVLADLAASEAVGFTHRGRGIISYELADADASIERLRACATRAVAAN